MSRDIRIGFAIFVLVPASGALAQHGGDILLSIENNRLVTGLINKETGETTPGVRVFGSDFGELAPNFTDEPGFDNEPGLFSPGAEMGFNIRAAVRSWDGASFGTVPMERIEVGFGPAVPVLSPLTDVLTPGFTLPVDGAGNWHAHLEYTLGAPASDGVYLLQLEIFTTQSGVAPTLPFWLVFNQNQPEEIHDAAIEWVEQNLVPSPGAAAAAGALGLLALRRRR